MTPDEMKAAVELAMETLRDEQWHSFDAKRICRALIAAQAECERLREAAMHSIERRNVECSAVGCRLVCATRTLTRAGWDVNRNGLWFCRTHAERAMSPEEHDTARTAASGEG